ncbi:MATE family efflux transporter [Oceanicoccus sagamiensis]|uniref:MATE family efflux transporter n=1 Tax=Oceanicoccus sagamiensis TaxID=716816 RepID=A0A1X9N7L2_9GAMM|nr:MATE family efflux transporter [Oceanicoccus sagamiensis]ARN74060.1 MATE family efflux transporter [Oceanicoccus sagamiensis]
MTLGRDLNHKIWRLAWPMIISNLSVPMLGLVDTAILGHLENAQYLAAVAVGGSILAFLYWGFGFLRMGTTGLTAQAFGADNHPQSRLIAGQSILLGLGIGLVIVFLSPFLLMLGLFLVVPPAGGYELAMNYAQIRIFSAPAVLVNYAIVGWFIGQQNTRWPLLITVFTNALNVGLDFLLIIGLDMKSEGAAIATLIAEYSGCGLALLLLSKAMGQQQGTSIRLAQLLHWPDYRQLLVVNRHLFVRTMVLLACFAFFTAQGSSQGDIVLAANTLIMNLLLLTSFGLDGFAHAAEALTGDAAGQRNRQRFLATCRQCALWSLITAGLFTLLFAVAGSQLIGLLTSINAVQAEALRYLPWLLLLPFTAVWSYLLDGIFIGTTQTAAMQNSMLLSALLVYLPCWYFSQQWGNHGLWFAFIAFNLARGLSLAVIFYRNNRRQSWW